MLGSALSRMFFVAEYGAGPDTLALWSSDATPAGTHRLLIDQPRAAFERLLVRAGGGALVGGQVLLILRDPATGRRALYATDGSVAGTSTVWVAPSGSEPVYGSVTELGSSVVFLVREVDGTHPWISDGTAAGTHRIARVGVMGTPSSSPRGGVELLDGSLLFFADDGSHGLEPWRSDGTAPGTVMIRDLDGAPTSSVPDPIDRVDPFSLPPFDWDPRDLGHSPYAVTLDGRALFVASDGTRNRLWISDGTTAGTRTLGNVEPEPGSLVIELADLDTPGSRAFFYGRDATHGLELWSTDGTGAGTRLAVDANTGSADGVEAGRWAFPRIGGVLFPADDGGTGLEPWVSDGTAAGSRLLGDVVAGADSSFMIGLGNLPDGRTVFSTHEPVAGIAIVYRVYVTDGTVGGTTVVETNNPPPPEPVSRSESCGAGGPTLVRSSSIGPSPTRPPSYAPTGRSRARSPSRPTIPCSGSATRAGARSTSGRTASRESPMPPRGAPDACWTSNRETCHPTLVSWSR